jgi:hypothetical protein
MSLSITTFRIMILSIMPFSIALLHRDATCSIMTPSSIMYIVTILSITNLSLVTLTLV